MGRLAELTRVSYCDKMTLVYNLCVGNRCDVVVEGKRREGGARAQVVAMANRCMYMAGGRGGGGGRVRG